MGSVLEVQRRGRRGSNLLTIQCSADSDGATARVDGELLQGVATDDGVAQKVVDRAILVCCRHLKAKNNWSGREGTNRSATVANLFTESS